MPRLNFDTAPSMSSASEAGSGVMIMTISYSGSDPYISYQPILRNRVIQSHPEKFIFITFAELEFEDDSDNEEYNQYVKEVVTDGVEVAGKLYLFCGHTSSQLRERSCFLYRAEKHEDVEKMINRFGDFRNITDVSERSKRIGQLFQSAEKIVDLHYQEFGETGDIVRKNEFFIDDCGFITEEFAKEIMRRYSSKRGNNYVPQVFQIRYRGYKGNLVVENEEVMKKSVIARTRQQILMSWVYLLLTITFWKILLFLKELPTWDLKVVFRKSMKTFSNCRSTDLYIVEHSKPSAPAKLTPEMISILSSLEVSDAIFEKKLHGYLNFIGNLRKSNNKEDAIKFLEYKGRFDLIRRLRACADMKALPKRLNEEFMKLEKEELKSSFDRNHLDRFQILIPKSRLLLGVLDPTGKLKKGECMVKVTINRKTLSTYNLNGGILVAKNGSLNPGHFQVLRAVHIKELNHLVDCIVFSREKKVPIIDSEIRDNFDPDYFFVSWDRELLPPITIPPLDNSMINSICKQKFRHANQQLDLIQYFTSYDRNLKKLLSLYSKWVKASVGERSFSTPCLTISILYAKCLDGEIVNIPQWILDGPIKMNFPNPFILVKLEATLKKHFEGRFDSFFNAFQNISQVRMGNSNRRRF